jgi:hypothetical protein
MLKALTLTSTAAERTPCGLTLAALLLLANALHSWKSKYPVAVWQGRTFVWCWRKRQLYQLIQLLLIELTVLQTQLPFIMTTAPFLP